MLSLLLRLHNDMVTSKALRQCKNFSKCRLFATYTKPFFVKILILLVLFDLPTSYYVGHINTVPTVPSLRW